jgi:hypothetical protein
MKLELEVKYSPEQLLSMAKQLREQYPELHDFIWSQGYKSSFLDNKALEEFYKDADPYEQPCSCYEPQQSEPGDYLNKPTQEE